MANFVARPSLHDAPRRDSYDAERRTTKGEPKLRLDAANLLDAERVGCGFFQGFRRLQ